MLALKPPVPKPRMRMPIRRRAREPLLEWTRRGGREEIRRRICPRREAMEASWIVL